MFKSKSKVNNNICKINEKDPYKFLSIQNILPWNVTAENNDLEEEDGVIMLKKLKKDENAKLPEILDKIFYSRKSLWQNIIRYRSFKYD